MLVGTVAKLKYNGKMIASLPLWFKFIDLMI